MRSDEQLVQEYRKGDETAYEELFERYRQRIFAYALRMLQNRGTAEEVFQEIFLTLHRKIGQYQEQARFAQWLFTIANHACLDQLRKQKRARWLVFTRDPVESISPANPEDELSGKQMHESIMKRVNALEIGQKQVFLLRMEGGLMFREIAELMNEPLNTVLGRYHQAVQALKQDLKAEPL